MRTSHLTTILCCAAAAEKRPHVIHIIADDLGWGNVGYHDAPPDTAATEQRSLPETAADTELW